LQTRREIRVPSPKMIDPDRGVDEHYTVSLDRRRGTRRSRF
jgi:hypothetical protein